MWSGWGQTYNFKNEHLTEVQVFRGSVFFFFLSFPVYCPFLLVTVPSFSLGEIILFHSCGWAVSYMTPISVIMEAGHRRQALKPGQRCWGTDGSAAETVDGTTLQKQRVDSLLASLELPWFWAFLRPGCLFRCCKHYPVSFLSSPFLLRLARVCFYCLQLKNLESYAISTCIPCKQEDTIWLGGDLSNIDSKASIPAIPPFLCPHKY